RFFSSPASPPSNPPSPPAGGVSPPQLVYTLPTPPNVKAYVMINTVQLAFWAFVYYLGWTNPNVPLWWGALGVVTTGFCYGALWARAHRTLQEIAMYADGQTFRFTTSDIL